MAFNMYGERTEPIRPSPPEFSLTLISDIDKNGKVDAKERWNKLSLYVPTEVVFSCTRLFFFRRFTIYWAKRIAKVKIRRRNAWRKS